MIEFVGLILALVVWMAVSLWLAAVFRMPIEVDRRDSSRSMRRRDDFEPGAPPSPEDTLGAVSRELSGPKTELFNLVDLLRVKHLDGSVAISRATAEVVQATKAPTARYEIATRETGKLELSDAGSK